jgi:hypothetical protein
MFMLRRATCVTEIRAFSLYFYYPNIFVPKEIKPIAETGFRFKSFNRFWSHFSFLIKIKRYLRVVNFICPILGKPLFLYKLVKVVSTPRAWVASAGTKGKREREKLSENF